MPFGTFAESRFRVASLNKMFPNVARLADGAPEESDMVLMCDVHPQMRGTVVVD